MKRPGSLLARLTGRPAPDDGDSGVLWRAAAAAFGEAVIRLIDDGAALAAGAPVLGACALALGLAEDADPAAILAALERLAPGRAGALRALRTRGAACEFSVDTPRGVVRAVGRAAGALAWLRLSLEAPRPGPPAGQAEPARPRGAAERRALDLILERMNDAVAVFAPDRRLAYANPAFARLWDLEPAWLAEGPAHGALLDRLRQTRRLPEAADYAAFKAGELARHERTDPSPETIWRVAGERLLEVLDLPDPRGGLVLIMRDITPELRLNTQFNQLIQVQRATLDKLTDAVAVFGADSRLKLWNEAFQTFWEIPSEALDGEPAYDEIVQWCVRRLHDLHFWRELKGRITDLDPGVRAAARGETPIADGRWAAWQSRPLPDGATLVSFADVTGTRRLEEALADREAALDLAERLKRDFVSSVSHELRTPLTTILGYGELLERGETSLSERGRGWVAAVRSAAADLARSVEDILALAELDAGELALDVEPTDIGVLVADAGERWATRAAAAGVALALETAESAGEIQADGARLGRVVDQLIERALRQTPPGGRVSLSVRRAPGEVCLEVADTGRGIPFHVQAHIFDRFSGEEGAGAGLGLALVKALVELHGGWVAVESEPGAGARFACHLPEAGQVPDEDNLLV